MLRKFTCSFLNHFSTNEILSIFSKAKTRSFSKGSFIFSENDVVSEIHFITSGKVEIGKNSDHGLRILYNLGAGDLLGIHHALTDKFYCNTAYVTENTTTISVKKDEFYEAMNRNTELRLWILKYLSCKIDSISKICK